MQVQLYDGSKYDCFDLPSLLRIVLDTVGPTATFHSISNLIYGPFHDYEPSGQIVYTEDEVEFEIDYLNDQFKKLVEHQFCCCFDLPLPV